MAVRLGRVNVDAMLRGLTAKQFVEWEYYARLEPFSEQRADWRAASIRETIFNMAVEKKDRLTLDKFLLKWDTEPEVAPKKQEAQPWQFKKAIAYAICEAYRKPAKDV